MQHQPRRVGLDDELLLEPSVRVDVGDALDRAQHRPHGIFLRLVQLHELSHRVHAWRRATPFERVVVDLAEAGRDRRQLRGASGGKLVAHRAQPLGDELPRVQLVGAVLVEQRDLAQPCLGQRSCLVEPGLTAHRALDGERHQPLGIFGCESGHLGVDLDLNAGDVGDRVDLQGSEGPHPDRGDQRGCQRHREPVVGHPAKQPCHHRASASPPLSARS